MDVEEKKEAAAAKEAIAVLVCNDSGGVNGN